MRAVIQRVNQAWVSVNQKKVASINKGLVIFLGVMKSDTPKEAENLAQKVIQLRIFNDQNRKMNLNAEEASSEFLVVSQFTLCADLNQGRRPSFDQAALAEQAEKLYLEFIQHLKKSKLKVEQGIFKEYMAVHLENDGPVTFTLNTEME